MNITMIPTERQAYVMGKLLTDEADLIGGKHGGSLIMEPRPRRNPNETRVHAQTMRAMIWRGWILQTEPYGNWELSISGREALEKLQ